MTLEEFMTKGQEITNENWTTMKSKDDKVIEVCAWNEDELITRVLIIDNTIYANIYEAFVLETYTYEQYLELLRFANMTEEECLYED